MEFFTFRIPKPPKQAFIWIRWLWPTPGKVIFTMLVISGLFWATSVGALPSTTPSTASTSTNTIGYRLISSIFSSGSSGVNAQSNNYQLASSFGEPALPNNQTDLTSQEYRHQPGFLAGGHMGDGAHIYLPLVRR